MITISENYQSNKKIALKELDYFYYQKGASCEFDNFKNKLNDDENKISLIAIHGDEVQGRIVGYYDEITNSVKIELLFVYEEFRGKKVGELLVKKFEEIAVDNGVTACFVDTSSTSAPLFYEKLNYNLIGKLNNYPMKGEEYYMYWKLLN
ncbi:GNAT family N-acetyltransferase [Vibrio cholerae]